MHCASNAQCIGPYGPYHLEVQHQRRIDCTDNGSEISVMKKRISDLQEIKGRNELVITNTVDGRIKPVDTLVVNFNIVSMDGYHTFNIVDAQLRETFRLSKRSIDLSALGSSRSRPYLFRIRRIRRHFDRSESHSRHRYL